MLDPLLLVACICIIIAVLTYFFYWNRLLGFVLSSLIKLMLWNQDGSSAWTNIGSIHFSLLAGRILMKDVTYHSSNQTIRIVKAKLQWRYWIRRPTTEEEIGTMGSEGENPKADNCALSCRVHISIEGFEWFLYNRTAAYDTILAQMGHMDNGNAEPGRPTSRSTTRRTGLRKPTTMSKTSLLPASLAGRSLRVPNFVRQSMACLRRQLPNLDPKELLPLGIEMSKGAIICGNMTTPNLLVAEFRRTEGTYGIVKSRSEYDMYKQILALNFQYASIRLVANDQYVQDHDMADFGELLQSFIKEHGHIPEDRHDAASFPFFTRIWRQLQLRQATEDYAGKFKRPEKAKKHTDDDIPMSGSAPIEYAIERKILEAPILELTYYTDVVGVVPPFPADGRHTTTDYIGNGDIPPEWGFDLVVRGGFLRYGPWTDRQRGELQRTFFPSTYRDAVPPTRLQPGDKRVWTTMHIFVELRDDTVFQIPFREASKDWQWDGHAKSQFPRPRKRDYAYIHVTAGDSSSISYVMSMVPEPHGYESSVEVHLDTITVTSSLNDIHLVSAETCRVRVEMPSPLKWNAERKWTVSLKLRQPVLYLLRDHINMFTDLGKDWASGPTNDYLRYIPTIYQIEADFHHYNIHLYVNDHNIIDKPLLNEENALFILHGQHLKSNAAIPANIFRAESTTIPLSVNCPELFLNLSLPQWNTNALHSPPHGHHLAKIGSLAIDGSYQYFSAAHPDYVEQFRINIKAKRVVYKLVGWSIRYLLIMKDNYFGSFTHFSTLSEYLDNRRMNRVGDPLEDKYREGKSNNLQVQISAQISEAQVVLPAGLPGYECGTELRGPNPSIGSCFVLAVQEYQMQFRLHDYLMDLSINTSPIMGYLRSSFPDKVSYIPLPTQHNDAPLYVDGVDVTAHRLFGPPPRASAYICFWEIHCGSVKSVLSAQEASLLLSVVNSFHVDFVDPPNIPATKYLPYLTPDVTFVKVSVDRLSVMWRAGLAAFVLNMPQGMKLDINDLPGKFYQKVTSLKVPSISAQVLLTASERKPWLEAAAFKADILMDSYVAPEGWRQVSADQMKFVEEQDRRTGRARRLITSLTAQNHTPAGHSAHINGLYLPPPSLTHPLPSRGRSILSEGTRVRSASQGSESDVAEGVSEADRDARLMRARSLTPLRLTKEEDQNMTSGDESDNEDLTEASTSDSDWSEDDESNDGYRRPSRSLLGFYSHLVNHFRGQYLRQPALWPDSPFIITKERPTSRFDISGRHDAEDNVDLWRTAAVYGADDLGVAIFRARCMRGVEVKVTPLLLSAAHCFEEDLFKEAHSAELCLDSLMCKFLLKQTASKDVSKTKIFDIQVPVIGINVLQHLAMDNGLPSLHLQQTPPRPPTTFDTLARLNCEMANIAFVIILGKHKSMINSQLGRLSLSFKTSPTNKLPHILTTPHNETELSCYLRGARFLQKGEELEVSWREFSTRVANHTAYFLAATAISLANTQEQLLAVHKRVLRRNSEIIQDHISNIIRTSRNRDFVEPLSTIQPSFLVQSGIPRELRTHITFRLLFYLRHCLWRLGLEAQNSQASLPGRNEEQRLETLLSCCLEYLEPDGGSRNNVLSVESLFSEQSQFSHPQPSSIPFRLLTVRLALITVTTLEPAGGSHSTLQLTDIQIQAHLRAFELLQSPFLSTPGSLSSREPSPLRTVKLFSMVSFGTVDVIIYPHLMRFVEHILRVRRHYINSQDTKQIIKPRGAKVVEFPITSIDLVGFAHSIRVQAIAKDLIFDFGIKGLKLSTSLLLQSLANRHGYSLNTSIFVDEIFFRARSPSMKQHGQDILASLEFSGAKITFVLKEDYNSRLSTRVVYVLQGIRFHIPRSAIRLYHFVDEWRKDFTAELGGVLQALVKEVQKAPTKPASPTPTHTSSRLPMVQVQGKLVYFCVSLQIMHGTWLDWDVCEASAFVNTANSATTLPTFSVGFQVQSQSITISGKAADGTTTKRARVLLPCISLVGLYNESLLQAQTTVDHITLKVKPSHWDTLLGVQQKFDQDFNDFLALVREKRSRPAPSPITSIHPAKKTFGYSLFIKIQGFRIGFECHSSTLFLECQDIGGGLHSDLDEQRDRWHLGMSDLALSLAPRTTIATPHGFSRNHRSAFVIIDIRASAGSDAQSNHVLSASVTKLHAVMQPSSIGEIGDFIDHIQADIMQRKEQRAQELAAFKEKTENILKTLEVVSNAPRATEKTSWLDDYVINLAVYDLGVAFPLSLDQDLELPQMGGPSSAVRAFLFSIKSVEFTAQRGESGQAIIQAVSFQFVSSFKQSDPNSFSPQRHQTRNRLVYPEMKAQLRSTKRETTRRIQIIADVSGFILDLDSSIPDYVFSVVDVYRRGKARVERLAAMVPRTPLPAEQGILQGKTPIEKAYSDIPTSNVIGSLTFASGKVRIYSTGAEGFSRSRLPHHSRHEPSYDYVIDEDGDVFHLPVVSVWAEYRATPAPQKIQSDREDPKSMLIFKSTIHSSQNTLRPTLLPFMTELVSHIEARMRRVSLRPEPVSLEVHTPSITTIPLESEATAPATSLQISFSLRIDKSRLELTCLPDVNVVAGVHWESGGFMINISPGAHKITFSGSVGGLTVGLKHGFLSEDCVKLDARNLAFSVNFSKFAVGSETPASSLAIVLDTQFLGEARFSRLQDILCFKAVWLDRIPVFNQSVAPPKAVVAVTPSQLPRASFSTIVLLRIRDIQLEVDLGQSISLVRLHLQNAVMRTKLTEAINDLSIVVANVAISASGNLSGHIEVPNCMFSTSRKIGAEFNVGQESGRMLELRMTSGSLLAQIKSGEQPLLHYRAQPLEVEVVDDWSFITEHYADQNAPLQLSFNVTSPEIVAAITVGTIPRLMSYTAKFQANLDAQREGASRESKTFRVTRTPKPENPLSAVAEAMLHSARSRFKEAGSGLLYAIKQKMSLRLSLLRLVLFPRTMEDSEMAHFVGQDVHARLERSLDADNLPIHRDIHLSLSSMVISKFTQLNHTKAEPLADIREWLRSISQHAPEATIVGLPSMRMHMISEETSEDQEDVLVYDFHSKFLRRSEAQESGYEDIFITLNVSLYSWLTVLRKNLTREMDQVTATAARKGTGSSRKRGTESVDTSRTSTTQSPFSASHLDKAESQTPILGPSAAPGTSVPFPLTKEPLTDLPSHSGQRTKIKFQPRECHIERLTMRQLGEATPDVMHPFFMKKAGFNLENALPQYVHEFATIPLEEIMEVLLALYSRQLLSGEKQRQVEK